MVTCTCGSMLSSIPAMATGRPREQHGLCAAIQMSVVVPTNMKYTRVPNVALSHAAYTSTSPGVDPRGGGGRSPRGRAHGMESNHQKSITHRSVITGRNRAIATACGHTGLRCAGCVLTIVRDTPLYCSPQTWHDRLASAPCTHWARQWSWAGRLTHPHRE